MFIARQSMVCATYVCIYIYIHINIHIYIEREILGHKANNYK